MSEEQATESNGWVHSKWGEYGDIKIGFKTVEETWRETHKTSEDYWEKKSDRVTRFYDQAAQTLINNLEEAKQALGKKKTKDEESALILRQGLTEYRNNRNYQYAQKWDE